MTNLYKMCTVFDSACKIDYAAWWQAFGSIAAIVFAGWLARSAETQKSADNFKLVEILLVDFKIAIQGLIHICESQNEAAYRSSKHKFTVMLDQAQQIDFKYLPYSAAVGMTSIRKDIIEITELLGTMPNAFGWANNRNIFERYFYNTAPTISEIFDTMRPSKWWKFNRQHV